MGQTARETAVRLLVSDGNTAADRDWFQAATGATLGQSYADLLRRLAPQASVDIVCPVDAGADLPGGAAAYDGVVLSGSALNVYRGGPEVTRQIDLIRTVGAAGTPLFGSCWGLQILVAAAGGSIFANPLGWEVGVARAIRLTEAGRDHVMYAGKADRFQALAIHRDAVETLPAGANVLAENDHSPVQAVELAIGAGVAWAVQYHPEFSFADLAGICEHDDAVLRDAGIACEPAAARAAIAEFRALDAGDAALARALGLEAAVLTETGRTRELVNWLERLVHSVRQRRGRA